MLLKNEERETIINFNQAGKLATIEVPKNTSLYRRLVKLGLNYKEVHTFNGDSTYVYEVPKKWIDIIPPKKVSEETKKHLAQIGAKTRFKKRDDS